MGLGLVLMGDLIHLATNRVAGRRRTSSNIVVAVRLDLLAITTYLVNLSPPCQTEQTRMSHLSPTSAVKGIRFYMLFTDCYFPRRTNRPNS